MDTLQPQKPLLIYDADCGFCTTTAHWIYHQTNQAIEIQGWQFIPERMKELGLTAADGMTQVWFVDQHGRLSGGAEAANRAMRLTWWAKPFTYLYHVPGIQQIQKWGYRWIANNRYKMPGSTEACAVPPKKQGQKIGRS